MSFELSWDLQSGERERETERERAGDMFLGEIARLGSVCYAGLDWTGLFCDWSASIV